jgi:hypothetical protein
MEKLDLEVENLYTLYSKGVAELSTMNKIYGENKMKINYKIGGLYPEGEEIIGKYVVAGELEQELGLLTLFASGDSPSHSDVVRHFCIDKGDILGGGELRLTEYGVEFTDFSGDYGAVPKEVAEELGKLLTKRKVSAYPKTKLVCWEIWEKYGIRKS